RQHWTPRTPSLPGSMAIRSKEPPEVLTHPDATIRSLHPGVPALHDGTQRPAASEVGEGALRGGDHLGPSTASEMRRTPSRNSATRAIVTNTDTSGVTSSPLARRGRHVGGRPSTRVA